MKLINNSLNNKVNFLCADPDKYGAGHLFRCINLYKYFHKLSFRCQIFINSDDKAGLIKSLQLKYNFNFDITKIKKSEWLVIDHYKWTMDKIYKNINI